MHHFSTRIAFGTTLAAALTVLALAAPLAAQSATPLAAQPGITVFQIGDFNRSSMELAQGDAKQPVTYTVGQSTAAKDWFSTQRVVFSPADASEPAAAPRTISFSIDHPAPSYTLHLAAIVKLNTVPAVEVGINGKHGRFYLHPTLNYDNGDGNDVFDPQYSTADVEFAFPGSYLHTGANTITIEVVEDADAPIPGAHLTWDALELDSASSPALAAPTGGAHSLTAQLEPTIFFVQQNGALAERVDVFLRSAKPVAAGGSADLALAGKHYRASLRGGYDFGEEQLQFLVPEFPAQTAAQLTVAAPGAHQVFKQSIDPQKKWTVWIVPHIHVDVGYSDYQAKVASIQARTIDEAMHMTADHPDFRFSLDGYWDFEQFLKTRSEADQKLAIDAVKNHQIFIPAEYANLLTGLPTAETLIRSLYPSAGFARKYGTPFDYANITDVPSYSWSYASILAAAGIHQFAAGSDNYRAPVLLQGRLNENTPTLWEGPDGQKVLLYYSRHYMQMQILFGLPPAIDGARDTLPIYLQMFEHPNYHSSSIIIFGTQVENTDLFPEQAAFAAQWNKIYAWPHMQYSGFHQALADIEKQFAGSLPTIRGDGAPYWEDGAGADAYYTAMERQNESRALTAEKLATLTSFTNPVLGISAAELNHLWTDMVLMDEHTWDAYNSVNDPTAREAVEQLAIKDQFAVSAHAEADFIVKRSLANVTDAIPAGPGSLIVFNSLNWKRTGLVTFDLPNNNEIVDTTTGQPVPYQELSAGQAFHRVRFTAEDVPAVGYKVYKLRHAEQSAAPAAGLTTTLESPYYKVTIDPATGSVTSIYDKQLNRELVNQQSPYRFGQYLYVTGGDKTPNTLIQYSKITPHADLIIHGAHDGQIVSVAHTPYGAVAHLRSSTVNTPSIETSILLFDHEKKIEFIENLDKTAVTTKEAAYFAFPFAMAQPQFQYEIQTGVVDPSKDQYAGAGHEWFTVQHWIAAQQDGASAAILPLDAPLVTLGDINRGLWPEQFGQRPGTIFSYIMNNYWDTNYRAEQGGPFHFRYVFTSASTTDAASLSRLGWEEATPLEQNFVTTQDKAVSNPSNSAQAGGPVGQGSLPGLSATADSFLTVSDPGVLLVTWKPAEDGNGTILRFLDFAGGSSDLARIVTVRSPLLHFSQVTQTNAVENGAAPVTTKGDQQFQFTLHPHQIATFRAVAK
jgi:hypothetical protein